METETTQKLEKPRRPHFVFTGLIFFLILIMVKYFVPESGLDLYRVIVLSIIMTGLSMLQELLDRLDND